jgi:F-type H+-transporting ATPase subunit alpha
MEVLKQDQYKPVPIEKQVVIIYAATNGFIDKVPVEAVKKFESEMIAYMETKQGALIKDIAEKKEITDDIKSRLNAALEEFGKNFTA